MSTSVLRAFCSRKTSKKDLKFKLTKYGLLSDGHDQDSQFQTLNLKDHGGRRYDDPLIYEDHNRENRKNLG